MIAKSIPEQAFLGESERMKRGLVRYAKEISKVFSRPSATPDARPNWYRDPLSHPDIARMSLRELADLQFRPECIEPE